MLVGREAEQRELDSLLDSARNERSAVLLLRGEAGIGKTALLEYAQAQAGDMKVLRCVGIEAEHELPFAGLHQLVRGQLGLIERLPTPQASALESAFGLAPRGVEDRFLVSLGFLSLLAEACDDRPLLACVDDAQWLDGPSAESLLFAARRLEAEPVALLIAVREGGLRRFDAPGLPELALGALAEADAEMLLSQQLDRPAAPEVVGTLVRTAAGNPLALLELPAGLSPRQLDGAEPILGPPPVRPAVEETFRARVAALPERTRRLLLVAAADEVGDLAAVRRAAERLGLEGSDLAPAERGGLVRVNGSVVFRHPLVRSAVYRAATAEERKDAHEALAVAVEDGARSAWHRALVASGSNEGLAAELEAAGVEAVTRGAQATAAAAFERAAELSEAADRRGHRLAYAAQASIDAGRPEAALALVERARTFVTDPLDTVALDLVRATDAGRRGSPLDAHRFLMEAGRRVAGGDPEVAAEMFVFAWLAAMQGGWAADAVPEAERAVELIPAEGEMARFAHALIRAASALLRHDPSGAAELFSEARALGERFQSGRRQSLNAFVCALTGDYPAARRICEATIAEQRARGAPPEFVGLYALLAICQLYEGRTSAALATTDGGLELAERHGFENDTTGFLALKAHIAAQQGREGDCRELARGAMQRSLARGLGWATQHALLALAELELGLGNPRAALEHYDQLQDNPIPPARELSTADVIDAALRLDERDRAHGSLERLEAWAPVSGAPLVIGLQARCRAILTEDAAEAKLLFEQALAEEGPVFQRARTQLAYGERLRRERRKTDARTQLRTALDTFEGLGTKAWAERARGELNATGETARKRDVSTLDELTPQELRIARLVAEGGTNREVAAQLFVSPKTVDYHLRKVFVKLGVSSRVELARIPLGEPAVVHD
jgi:DNA-binding CsgD family transcriptional regulator